jgi:hypothetical protein
MNDIVDEALKAKYVVISKCGPHAGEGYSEMFRRKQAEIDRSGPHRSFWYYRSRPAVEPARPWTADPNAMKKFCNEATESQGGIYCIFIGSGRPGVTASPATHFSEEGPWPAGHHALPEHFKRVPYGIHPTGQARRDAYAMVLSQLADTRDHGRTMCIWDYSSYGHSGTAVRHNRQGSTNLCEKASSHSDPLRMYKRPRQGMVEVVGVGKLAEPFSVWLAWEPA